MPLFAPVTQRSRLARREPIRRAEMPARVVATALGASLALALAGCATPVLQPAVDVPARFAAADSAVEADSEVAWWESYNDPVLTDLIRRAARTRSAAILTSRFSRAVRRTRSDSTGSP
jgi:outer membrane protein, multidrug efflux system